MNCILVTDEELINKGLNKFVNRLPVYMRGSPASIQYNPWQQVYVVPETDSAFSWIAAAKAGKHHNFDKDTLARMGWLNPSPNQ